MNVTRQIARKLENIFEQAPDKSFAQRYGVATFFVLIAFWIRMALEPTIHSSLEFTFFITSSMLAAFFGGFGTGVYALVLGWFLADYFFVPPIGTIGGYNKVQAISLISDLGPAFFAIFLIHLLHRARRRVREELLARREAEAQLSAAKGRLEQYSAELERRVSERTAELQESVQFLEGFCYSIAHDLRAPLRAMQGFIVALQEDSSGPVDETERVYRERIFTAAQRMDKLLLDLLDYGRLSHSRLTLADLSLEAAVKDVISRLDELIAVQHAQIMIVEPLLDVRADPLLLELVLFHLLKNAFQFNRPGIPLRVELCSEERGGYVRVLIRDNGIGIEPEYQQRIFGLFETLRPASATTTGAGLALASKAVQRMNGKIGVESELGQGSTFWIELQKAHKLAASDGVSPRRTESSSRRVPA